MSILDQHADGLHFGRLPNAPTIFDITLSETAPLRFGHNVDSVEADEYILSHKLDYAHETATYPHNVKIRRRHPHTGVVEDWITATQTNSGAQPTTSINNTLTVNGGVNSTSITTGGVNCSGVSASGTIGAGGQITGASAVLTGGVNAASVTASGDVSGANVSATGQVAGSTIKSNGTSLDIFTTGLVTYPRTVSLRQLDPRFSGAGQFQDFLSFTITNDTGSAVDVDVFKIPHPVYIAGADRSGTLGRSVLGGFFCGDNMEVTQVTAGYPTATFSNSISGGSVVHHYRPNLSGTIQANGIKFSANAGTTPFFHYEAYVNAAGGDYGSASFDGGTASYPGYNTCLRVNSTGSLITRGILPCNTTDHNLGSSAKRWNDIFYDGGSLTSDKRLKEQVQGEVPGMSFVEKMKPVQYRWKKNGKRTHFGFYAQDLHEELKVLYPPEDGTENKNNCGMYWHADIPERILRDQNGKETGREPAHDICGIRAHEIVPVLCKAIQELNNRLKIVESQLYDGEKRRKTS